VKDKQKTSHNVVLKAETYDRLDVFKANLIGKRGTSNISFDDAINVLLQLVDKE